VKITDKLKNLIIGVFVIAAIAITISIILFLEPKVGDGEKKLNVRFSNIAGLNIGTRVTFAGKPVGEITSIHEITNAREQPTDELGRVYFYQLTLQVDSSVEVYDTDEVTIATTGLMGEKSIAIIPKAPPAGKVPKLIANQVIYADSIDPLENTLYEITNLSKSVEDAVKNLDGWFVENSEELSFAISSFNSAMNELDLVIHSLNQEEMVVNLKDAVNIFNKNMQLIQTSITDFQNENTISNFNTALTCVADVLDSFKNDGKEILQNINKISKDIANGSGSIGKLVNDDDMYLRAESLFNKANTLLNDVNHYGLLFQYDKKWQRTRKKRANLLNSLNSPKQFQDYFEKEIDQINTSLSRLNLLLEKADNPENKNKIVNSKVFLKNLKLLLNQIDSLSSTVKTYNEDLIDQIDVNQ
jgi:phospholipid/cholesterol/gamma-HCH transport system substrate-binding protein